MARKGTWEMVAELMRDGGILLLAFGYLDQILSERGFRLVESISVFLTSGALLASGLGIERSRPDEED